MQVLCHHPVPVRWRPPRLAVDRHALLGVRTPVEIPEADRAPDPVRILMDGSVRDLFAHGGAVYERMTGAGLHPNASGAPATPELLARVLGAPRPAPGLSIRNVTPLRASNVIEGFADGSGEDLPDRILSLRTGPDNTAAARAGLAAYVARTFLVHGPSVYALQSPQTITPHAFHRTGMATDAIGKRGYGLGFVGSRLDEMDRYLRRIGYRGAKTAIPEMIGGFREGNDTSWPQPDQDLDLWINEVPWYVEGLATAETGRAALYDIDLTAALAHVERLRPYVELGLVGAIAREDRQVVAEILGNAIDALRSALPDRHTQPPLSWLKAYSDIVAKPAIGLAPLPEEDMDDLAGLAPGMGRR